MLRSTKIPLANGSYVEISEPVGASESFATRYAIETARALDIKLTDLTGVEYEKVANLLLTFGEFRALAIGGDAHDILSDDLGSAYNAFYFTPVHRKTPSLFRLAVEDFDTPFNEALSPNLDEKKE